MCTTIITVIFGLIAVAHLYSALGAIDKAQPRFSRKVALLSGVIWAAGVSYFVLQLYLIIQSSDVKVGAFVLMVRYFCIVDVAMTGAWLAGASALVILCVHRVIKGSAQSVIDPYHAAIVNLCDQPENIVRLFS